MPFFKQKHRKSFGELALDFNFSTQLYRDFFQLHFR